MNRITPKTPRLPLTRHLLLAGLMVALCSGCAFIEAATEQTIGEENIPPVSQEITWPSVDKLTGLDAEQINALAQQGFPTSLAQGTFAHLQGALKLSGQCQLTQSLDEAFAADPTNPMKSMAIDVVSCTDDACTDVPVCEEFRGMSFTANVTLELFDAAQAAELQETLAIVPQEALVQLRFLVSKLNFFRDTCENDSHCSGENTCCGEGTLLANRCTASNACNPSSCTSPPSEDCLANNTERGSIHSNLDDFQLLLSMGDGPQVLVIDKPYLSDIAESPQRFDVDIDSPFTKELKDKIFPCDPLNLPEGQTSCPPFAPPQITVSLSMRIAQKDLYQVSFEGAGLELTIQPEIVVSVIEVVKGQI